MKKFLLLLFVGIFASVVFGQTKTELKPADLPKSVTDFIAKNIKAYTIDKAFKVDSKGVITYDVLILKGADKSVLIFDKDGKFVKRAERGSKGGMLKGQEAKPQPQPQPAVQKKAEPKK